MKTRGLLIAVAVLAVLGGGIWWTNRQTPAGEATKESEKSIKLMSLLEADLNEVKVTVKGEAARLLKKDSVTQKWVLESEKTKDPAFRTDHESALSIINNSSTFPTDKVVDENATDLIQYGLDPPQIVVEIKDKNGKTDVVHLGDETPVGQMVYAAKPGSKKVYTVAKYLKEGVIKAPLEIRDRRLAPVDESKVTRFEWTRKGETLEFGKNAQGEWQIVKPEPMRADNLAVGELFRKAKEAKYESALTPETAKKNAASFATAELVASVRITDANGTQTLEVKKTKDNTYLAKGSGTEGIHTVSEELGSGLDKAADEFRNKKLFDFGYDDVERVEVQKDGKTTVLEKKGDDWHLGGKKADAASVTPVIDQARMMQAMKFVKKAMGAPTMTITLKAKSSKTPEKVLISANGNFRYAQREGEATEYEIDPKIISDFEAALGAIKLDGQKK
jgi:hypothetical protein